MGKLDIPTLVTGRQILEETASALSDIMKKKDISFETFLVTGMVVSKAVAKLFDDDDDEDPEKEMLDRLKKDDAQ